MAGNACPEKRLSEKDNNDSDENHNYAVEKEFRE